MVESGFAMHAPQPTVPREVETYYLEMTSPADLRPCPAGRPRASGWSGRRSRPRSSTASSIPRWAATGTGSTAWVELRRVARLARPAGARDLDRLAARHAGGVLRAGAAAGGKRRAGLLRPAAGVPRPGARRRCCSPPPSSAPGRWAPRAGVGPHLLARRAGGARQLPGARLPAVRHGEGREGVSRRAARGRGRGPGAGHPGLADVMPRSQQAAMAPSAGRAGCLRRRPLLGRLPSRSSLALGQPVERALAAGEPRLPRRAGRPGTGLAGRRRAARGSTSSWPRRGRTAGGSRWTPRSTARGRRRWSSSPRAPGSGR